MEHLIFLGSEDYPYKGVLDIVANRCLASGTNAWTDIDHTCYVMDTAGSEGFLTLMPIYLDHILYPCLTVSKNLNWYGDTRYYMIHYNDAIPFVDDFYILIVLMFHPPSFLIVVLVVVVPLSLHLTFSKLKLTKMKTAIKSIYCTLLLNVLGKFYSSANENRLIINYRMKVS